MQAVQLCRGIEESTKLKEVAKDVVKFSTSFAMPGFDVKALANYNDFNGKLHN